MPTSWQFFAVIQDRAERRVLLRCLFYAANVAFHGFSCSFDKTPQMSRLSSRSPSATIRSESGMNGLLLQPGRDEVGLRSPGPHRVTGWGGYLFFQSSGLFFPSLTNQQPLTRLPHAIGVRIF
jgi:hypothetical protein